MTLGWNLFLGGDKSGLERAKTNRLKKSISSSFVSNF